MKYFLYFSLLVLVGCSSVPASENTFEFPQIPHHIHHMNHGEVVSEEMFIFEMIPHHQEAVDTSKLVFNSSNERLRVLAQAIIATQEAEIELMSSWIVDWYDNSSYVPTYTPMMRDLTVLEGTVRDSAYIRDMILHHQGAVAMAEEVLTLDIRPEVRTLAEEIIRTQKEEIALLSSMLG